MPCKWVMNTSSDAIRAAESATERLELELERLRSELDRCTTQLQLTEKLVEHAAMPFLWLTSTAG